MTFRQRVNIRLGCEAKLLDEIPLLMFMTFQNFPTKE